MVFFLDLHSLQFGPASEWILGLHSSLPDNFAVPSATVNMNSSSFCVINTSFALILRRTDFRRVHVFPAPQRLRPSYLLAKFTPRTMHVYQVKHFLTQIGGALTGPSQK